MTIDKQWKRQFKNERAIKAVKDHVCEYCLETIERGSFYCQRFKVYDKLIDGDEFENPPIKVHLECRNASQDFGPKEWLSVSQGVFDRPEDRQDKWVDLNEHR
jgi:hypothetical protein